MPGPARATHDEPGRGKAIKGSLVTAYEKCTAPNSLTEGGFAVPACAPPVRSDPVCGFGALDGMVGAGKAKGVVHDGDVELTAVLSGLGLGCDGWRLCGVVSVRVTTDRCGATPCTTIDLTLTNESATGCCTVSQGNCRLRTTVNTEVFGAIRMGERAGIQLLGCGLRRIDGPTAPPPDKLSFVCGMLAP
ncbi:MAG: hypothetical protein ACREQL_03625 [Candidatus Binatia bacterium]